MNDNSLLPIVSRTQVSDVVDDHFHGIYKALQDFQGITDGGEAAHFHSGDGEDLQEEIVNFFMEYIKHERLVGPKKLTGDRLIEARIAEIIDLYGVYDTSHWSSENRASGWTFSGDYEYMNSDLYIVYLSLVDTATPLVLKVEFAPDTARVIGVDAPRYLDAYSPYTDHNYLWEARQVEANAAIEAYAAGEGVGSGVSYSGFRVDGRNKVATDFSLGTLCMFSHVMTVEFRPYSPEVVHISVESMEEALVRAEGHGAFCD